MFDLPPKFTNVNFFSFFLKASLLGKSNKSFRDNVKFTFDGDSNSTEYGSSVTYICEEGSMFDLDWDGVRLCYRYCIQ